MVAAIAPELKSGRERVRKGARRDASPPQQSGPLISVQGVPVQNCSPVNRAP